MGKNPAPKLILIIVLVVVGIFLLFAGVVSTIYIARKVRILPTDMTGGTSLVYAIDTRGLSEEEKKDLSRRMIAVLQRRIDPANIQNLVWRPLGNTRFEIQIPPASFYNPNDLQRMLKGAGILEFRILPTLGHEKVDSDEMTGYAESLREKGPKYALDNKHVWCEIENINEWMGVDEQGRPFVRVLDGQQRPSVVAQFGEKHYVLASNKQGETMLHSAGGKGWRLKKAKLETDRMGRRAIGFTLDERGGKVFFTVTEKNLDRPLCVLLDGIAISAPTIQARISTEGIITGNFTQTKVEDIVNKLNAGCLPARLIEQPISVKIIGPPIGADNHDKGTAIEGNSSKDK